MVMIYPVDITRRRCYSSSPQEMAMKRESEKGWSGQARSFLRRLIDWSQPPNLTLYSIGLVGIVGTANSRSCQTMGTWGPPSLDNECIQRVMLRIKDVTNYSNTRKLRHYHDPTAVGSWVLSRS